MTRLEESVTVAQHLLADAQSALVSVEAEHGDYRCRLHTGINGVIV